MVEIIIPVALHEDSQSMLLTSLFDDMMSQSKEALQITQESLNAGHDPIQNELMFLVGATSVLMQSSIDGQLDIEKLSPEQIQQADDLIKEIMLVTEGQRDAISAVLGDDADGFFAALDANNTEYATHLSGGTLTTEPVKGPDAVIQEQGAEKLSTEDVLQASLLETMQSSDDARDVAAQITDFDTFTAMLNSRTPEQLATLLSPDKGSEFDVVKGSLLSLMENGAEIEQYGQVYGALDAGFDRIEGAPDFNSTWMLNYLVTAAQTEDQLHGALDAMHLVFLQNEQSFFDVISENPDILIRLYENKPDDFNSHTSALDVIDWSGIGPDGVQKLILALDEMPESDATSRAISSLNTILNPEQTVEMTASDTPHYVKQGDTLTSIAQNYDGVSWQEIASLNNITDPTALQKNQMLLIPSVAVAAVAEVEIEVDTVAPKVISTAETIETAPANEPSERLLSITKLEGPEAAMSAEEHTAAMLTRTTSQPNIDDPLAPSILDVSDTEPSASNATPAVLEQEADPLAPTALTEEKPAENIKEYTIQRGDTLSSIARAHETSVEAIMEINPQIENSNRIYPNADIQIPTSDTTTGLAVEVRSSEPHDYEIQRGDTLGKIARLNGVSVQDIMDINPEIKNRNVISEGASIKIPGQELEIKQPQDDAPTTLASSNVTPSMPLHRP